MFNSDVPISLPPIERESCDKELTHCELKAALVAMKNDTSPGPNGYTVEFFIFWCSGKTWEIYSQQLSTKSFTKVKCQRI